MRTSQCSYIVLPYGLKQFVQERIASNVKYSDLFLDKALFLLSLIKIEFDEKKERYVSEYEAISSNELQKYVRSYKDYFTFFGDIIDGKNILYRENYKPGVTYFRYKFSNGILNSQKFEYVKITDWSLVGKITREEKKIIKKQFSKVGKFFKFYDSEYINFNEDLIDDYFLNPEGFNKSELINSYHSMNGIKNITKNRFRVTRKTEKCTRLYSDLTMLKKTFRDKLIIQRDLVEGIDMSGSVPTMLGFLLSNSIQSNFIENTVLSNKLFYSYYISVKNSVALDNTEVKEYLQMVMTGQIYDEFISYSEQFFNEVSVKDEWNLDILRKKYFPNFKTVDMQTKSTV